MKFKPNLAVLLGLSLALPLSGATVTLNSGDALGASSFNAGTNWSDGTAPSAGNDYVVSVWGLRTPADNASHTFAGDSLTISGNGTAGGGGLNFKGGGAEAVITIDDLVLSGGFIQHNQGFSDEFHLAGTVTIAGSNTTIHAKQGNIFIEAAVLGTAPLTLQSTDNGNGYYVTFSSALNEYTGDVTVAGNFGLAEGGVWNFAYADGSYNSITGTGYTLLEGTLRISLPEVAEGIPEGTQWTLIGTAVGYGANFSIEGWTKTTDYQVEGYPVSFVSPEGTFLYDATSRVLTRIDSVSGVVGGTTVYVPESWILRYYASVSDFSVSADSDGDGYSNYEEYVAGSDPAEGASIPGDVDGDGLPDEWEIESFGNLNQGPEDDTDGDFNTNLEEYLAETDPASADDFPIVYVAEVDGFVNEGWIKYYFDTVSGFAPLADEDGDGYSNFEEYEAGTDPLEMVSSPASGSHGIPDGWILYYYADPEKTREAILSEFDPLADTDGDNLPNSLEYLTGTDPTDADSSLGTVLGYWRFEESTSGDVPGGANGAYAYPTSVLDSSPYGNHLMTWASYSAPTYQTNIPSNRIPLTGATNTASLYFREDRTADPYYWKSVFTTAASRLTPPGGFLQTYAFNEVTVELSFNTIANGQWQVPIVKGGNPIGGQPPFSIKIDTSNFLRAGIVDGSGVAREVIGRSVIASGSWYSVAVTVSDTEMNLWLKKPGDTGYELEGTVAVEGAWYVPETGPLNSNWEVGYGVWNGSASDFFLGSIDEVKINATALELDGFLFSPTEEEFSAWAEENITDPERRGKEDDPDGDGLTNYVEMSYDTNPMSVDTDGDGLSDYDEIYTYFTDPSSADTDGDGLSDAEEITAGTNPRVADTDGDGFQDGYEVAHGSDPLDAASVPGQSAGFIKVEDFEGTGMAIGETFSGVHGWTASAPAAATVVENAVAGGQAGQWASGYLSRSLNPEQLQILDGNTGTVFLQLRFESAATDHSFGLSDVASPTAFGDFEAQTAAIGGNFRVRNGASTIATTYNFEAGQWMNVWIVVNNATDTYKVFVESPSGQTGQIEITSGNTYTFRNSSSGLVANALTTLFFIENVSPDVPVLLDNIYVDPVSENLVNPVDGSGPVDEAYEIWAAANIPDASQRGAGADPDGDGTSNFVEYKLGLDPLDGSSFFGAAYDGAELRWPSVSGVSFAIERSADLLRWEEVATVAGAVGTGTWTDPSPLQGKAFYRVSVSLATGN